MYLLERVEVLKRYAEELREAEREGEGWIRLTDRKAKEMEGFLRATARQIWQMRPVE